MQFSFANIAWPYLINQPEAIHTPRLLVFQDRVESNVRTMRRLLHSVNPQLDVHCLCPHVKTHKSARITRFLLEHGVSFFKASLNEIDMLVQCAVPQIFVAYPLLEKDAGKIAGLMKVNPNIAFRVQVARTEHVDILQKLSREFGVKWHYYIDVNVGMNRTGLPVEDAFDFYLSIKEKPSLEFVGVHAYDGHIHHKNSEERQSASDKSMNRLKKTLNHFAQHGVKVPQCIVAGTPGFLPDVEFWRHNKADTDIFYSPGTWIYFDSATNEMMPNTFDYAAVILAQVIDKPTSDTATLNLGHKRWAVDQGPVDTLSIPGKVVSWSEEHTVLQQDQQHQLKIGDYVLIAPRHVCSTVNLWEHVVIIDKNGDIEEMTSPIEGRNR